MNTTNDKRPRMPVGDTRRALPLLAVLLLLLAGLLAWSGVRQWRDAALLDDMQRQLYERALRLRETHTRPIDSLDEFRAFFTPQNEEKPEIHGGFALCHWCEDPAVAAAIDPLKVTIRCVPLDGTDEPGRCIFTGRPSTRRAVFAKAY